MLFHGLTGAPSELWPLGLGLAAAGYRVEAPLWPGHGTSPEDLARRSADELIRTARRFTEDPEIAAIGGLSMGALLALIAAAGRPRTRALILMAPALRLRGKNHLFVELMRLPGVAHLPLMMPKGGTGPKAARISEPSLGGDRLEEAAARAAEGAIGSDEVDGRYDRIPFRWGRELFKLQRLAAAAAPQVTCPVLLLHGLRDGTASPGSAQEIARLVRGSVSARFFPDSEHVLTLGPDRGAVAAEVARFLATVVPRDQHLSA